MLNLLKVCLLFLWCFNEFDVTESRALMCDVAETVEKEPSVSTKLMNFNNSFDPFGAISTPLYQTSTFKQVI